MQKVIPLITGKLVRNRLVKCPIRNRQLLLICSKLFFTDIKFIFSLSFMTRLSTSSPDKLFWAGAAGLSEAKGWLCFLESGGLKTSGHHIYKPMVGRSPVLCYGGYGGWGSLHDSGWGTSEAHLVGPQSRVISPCCVIIASIITPLVLKCNDLVLMIGIC